MNGCPLCGFGRTNETSREKIEAPKEIKEISIQKRMISIPPDIICKQGRVITNEETNVWGSWLMFNDFFAPKFLCRLIAWKMQSENLDSIYLNDLMNSAVNLVKRFNLSQYKGFPNLEKDGKGTRLVYHFLTPFVNMGLVEAESKTPSSKDVWKEKWENVQMSITREGLEFAQIKNNIFDEGIKEQILLNEESKWLIEYLKTIDAEGYKEYSVLKEVYEFIKSGKNGNKDLWAWFENNEKFQNHIRNRSEKARTDEMIFKKQLQNYSRSFASAKISLLRELGVIKNKRNDYTIMGDL